MFHFQSPVQVLLSTRSHFKYHTVNHAYLHFCNCEDV